MLFASGQWCSSFSFFFFAVCVCNWSASVSHIFFFFTFMGIGDNVITMMSCSRVVMDDGSVCVCMGVFFFSFFT